MYKPILDDPSLYFNNLRYIQHYKTAIRIYDNNKIFGTGLKNYRIESGKQNYQHPKLLHIRITHFEFCLSLGLWDIYL